MRTTLEERYAAAVACLRGRGSVRGLLVFGDDLWIFWTNVSELWGPAPDPKPLLTRLGSRA